MKKINVFSTFLCTILLLVFAVIFVGCDFSNAGVNNSTPDMDQNDNNDCTHPSTEWKIDKEATCTTAGSKHEECSNCGKTLSTESISSLGHDYNETIIPPTEEQQGYTLHQCSRCADNYKDNFVDYEYTEAQYKQMFETKLFSAIQDDFNEDYVSEKAKINELEVTHINYETGDIYFNAERNNKSVFIVTNHKDIASFETYKEAYENCPTEGFQYDEDDAYKVYTVQEDDLAEEIVEFALTQPELQEYITTNNLDLSNYTIINATEFKSYGHGTESDFIIVTNDNKILKGKLIGTTGVCGSQKEYLEKLKQASNTRIEEISLTEYYEIPVVTE